jgi:hypothetical protein
MLDVCQVKVEKIRKTEKLFAHTEKNYYLCIVKRKKEGKTSGNIPE